MTGQVLVRDPWGEVYGSGLYPQHAAKLAASRVSAEVARARGYVTADNKAQLARYGFGAAQQRPPALIIPLHGVTGDPAGHQLRPDDPRCVAGRVAKYETKTRAKMVLDVPPRVRPMLGDPSIPLVVTEGPLKADAGATAGLAAVALLGVWGWRGTNADGGRVALADWEYVALNDGRRVVIAFDSDVMLKASVYEALIRLGEFLGHRGADVAFAYLPPGEHGAKVGLDDWLAGHQVEDFWPLVSADLRRPPGDPAVESEPEDTFDDVAEEDGSELLDGIEAHIRRYVAFPSTHHATAATLWVAHTHALDAFESTARLAVLSPEKGSGKTRLLEAAGDLVARPLRVANVSAAALYRLIAARRPTLLLDEADATFGRDAGPHEDLRAVINAGHRKGATVPRCVGDGASMAVEEFPCYCAVALAGIGDLPDTIKDRAVLIPMRRRAPAETVEPYRVREAAEAAAPLRRRLEAWGKRCHDALASCRPLLPPGVEDRPADVWEALVAVADVAGGSWPERARAAAAAIVAEAAADEASWGVRLLADCRRVFAGRAVDRIRTADLLDALLADEEAPWSDLRHPLNARGLAQRLRPYGIKPHSIRIDAETPKGYEVADFADAWARYLHSPPAIPAGAATSATSATRGHLPATPATPHPPLTCDVADVADVAAVRKGADRVADAGARVADGNGRVADSGGNARPGRSRVEL